MTYEPIHKRPYRDMTGLTVTFMSDYNGEPAVLVSYNPGFVFGNTTPYSDGKMQACKLLDKNYDRMRVIEVGYSKERVNSLIFAYRKAGA